MDREVDKQTDKWEINRQVGRCMNKQKVGQTSRQMDKQIDRLTDKQTDGQTRREMDEQVDRLTEK